MSEFAFALDTACVVARLKDQSVCFKLIGGAAEYDAAVDGLTVSPACFVMELASSVRSQGSSTYTATTQMVQAQIGLIIAVQFAGDVTGAREPLRDARASAAKALLGWQLDSFHEPLTYVGGSILDFEPGTIWWQDAYTTAFAISNR